MFENEFDHNKIKLIYLQLHHRHPTNVPTISFFFCNFFRYCCFITFSMLLCFLWKTEVIVVVVVVAFVFIYLCICVFFYVIHHIFQFRQQHTGGCRRRPRWDKWNKNPTNWKIYTWKLWKIVVVLIWFMLMLCCHCGQFILVFFPQLGFK